MANMLFFKKKWSVSENAFLMDKNRDQFSCGRLRGRPDAWNGFVLLASCEERVAIYG